MPLIEFSRKFLFTAQAWLILSVLASVGTGAWLYELRCEDARLRRVLEERNAEIQLLRKDVNRLHDDIQDMTRRVTGVEAQFWE